jgi:hypothetical protein
LNFYINKFTRVELFNIKPSSEDASLDFVLPPSIWQKIVHLRGITFDPSGIAEDDALGGKEILVLCPDILCIDQRSNEEKDPEVCLMNRITMMGSKEDGGLYYLPFTESKPIASSTLKLYGSIR